MAKGEQYKLSEFARDVAVVGLFIGAVAVLGAVASGAEGAAA